jgi:hypothetical protein
MPPLGGGLLFPYNVKLILIRVGGPGFVCYQVFSCLKQGM